MKPVLVLSFVLVATFLIAWDKASPAADIWLFQDVKNDCRQLLGGQMIQHISAPNTTVFATDSSLDILPTTMGPLALSITKADGQTITYHCTVLPLPAITGIELAKGQPAHCSKTDIGIEKAPVLLFRPGPGYKNYLGLAGLELRMGGQTFFNDAPIYTEEIRQGIAGLKSGDTILVTQVRCRNTSTGGLLTVKLQQPVRID